jgi:hypothetical protein
MWCATNQAILDGTPTAATAAKILSFAIAGVIWPPLRRLQGHTTLTFGHAAPWFWHLLAEIKGISHSPVVPSTDVTSFDVKMKSESGTEQFACKPPVLPDSAYVVVGIPQWLSQ